MESDSPKSIFALKEKSQKLREAEKLKRLKDSEAHLPNLVSVDEKTPLSEKKGHLKRDSTKKGSMPKLPVLHCSPDKASDAETERETLSKKSSIDGTSKKKKKKSTLPLFLRIMENAKRQESKEAEERNFQRIKRKMEMDKARFSLASIKEHMKKHDEIAREHPKPIVISNHHPSSMVKKQPASVSSARLGKLPDDEYYQKIYAKEHRESAAVQSSVERSAKKLADLSYDAEYESAVETSKKKKNEKKSKLKKTKSKASAKMNKEVVSSSEVVNNKRSGDADSDGEDLVDGRNTELDDEDFVIRGQSFENEQKEISDKVKPLLSPRILISERRKGPDGAAFAQPGSIDIVIPSRRSSESCLLMEEGCIISSLSSPHGGFGRGVSFGYAVQPLHQRRSSDLSKPDVNILSPPKIEKLTTNTTNTAWSTDDSSYENTAVLDDETTLCTGVAAPGGGGGGGALLKKKSKKKKIKAKKPMSPPDKESEEYHDPIYLFNHNFPLPANKYGKGGDRMPENYDPNDPSNAWVESILMPNPEEARKYQDIYEAGFSLYTAEKGINLPEY